VGREHPRVAPSCEGGVLPTKGGPSFIGRAPFFAPQGGLVPLKGPVFSFLGGLMFPNPLLWDLWFFPRSKRSQTSNGISLGFPQRAFPLLKSSTPSHEVLGELFRKVMRTFSRSPKSHQSPASLGASTNLHILP